MRNYPEPQTMFQGNLFHFFRKLTEQVNREVAQLPESVLLGNDLAYSLDTLVEKHTLNVAKIDPGAKSGKRRTATREISDYGERRTIDDVFIDVAIPFSGDRRSFELSPSQSTLITDRFSVLTNQIVISLRDNSDLEKSLSDIERHISGALDQLRVDVQTNRATMRADIEQFARNRATDVVSRNNLDKGRSFPIS